MNEGIKRDNPSEESKKPEKLTRREAFKAILEGVAVGTAIVGAGYSAFKYQKFLDIFDNTNNEFEKEPAVKAAKAYLKKEYGIVLLSGDSWDYSHTGERVDNEQYLRALTRIIRTMAKYPKFLFSEKGLVLRLMYNLKVLDVSQIARGLVRRVDGQTRGFFDTIVINATTMVGAEGSNTIDHELYHLFDYREGGYTSEEWVRMHEEVCACNPYGARHTQEKAMVRVTDDLAFASGYGRTNEMEDRATWAEVVMDSYQHQRFRRDVGLPSKEFCEYLSQHGHTVSPEDAERVRTLMLEKYQKVIGDYRRWSKGHMNAQYWDDLCNEKIGVLNTEMETIVDKLLALRERILTSAHTSR